MGFLFSLIPATVLVVVGYFVIYAATRTQGALQRFGQYLGAWIFLLAGAVILAGVLASTGGIESPLGDMGRHMQRMESMEQEQLAMLREVCPERP